MADTSKRGPASGRVATPKAAATSSSPANATSPASQPSRDTKDILATAPGTRIHIKTIEPDSRTLEGVLFTSDPILHIVAVNCAVAPPNPSTSLSSQPGDFHIIPIKHISEWKVLSSPAPQSVSGKGADNAWASGDANTPAVTKVDHRRLKEREEKAVQKLKDEELKRGKGVSPMGQELFNVLDKMYSNQTRWAGESIILMDSVRIDPPYGSEDVKAPKDKQSMLPHLRKVVDGERRKIASRSPGTGTPPFGQRKGG